MLVQYIAIALLVVLIFFAFVDFKKAVLIWLPFKLLFNDQIAVRYESPGMALVIAGDLALLGVFFLKRNNKGLNNTPFLFKRPMIAFAVSYVISTIFTIASLQSAVIASVKFFSSGFFMLYLAQKCFKDISDIKLFVKCCIIVSFLIVVLAISENVLRTNLWLDFVSLNSPFDIQTGRMFYVYGSQQMRYGLVQAFSFFSFHVPFGFACICLFWILGYFSRYTNQYKGDKWIMIVFYLLIIGTVLSLSKQAYLGLFIMMLSLFSLRTIINIKTTLPLIVIWGYIMVYVPEYSYTILSLSDEKLAMEGGGSTIALRIFQYDTAWNMFVDNPLIGNGIASIETMRGHGFEGIFGAESSWLRILPERGLLGAFTYLYLFYCLWSFRKHIDKKILSFFLLSIFVVEFAGGLKDISLWGTVLLAVYRYNQLKNTTLIRKRPKLGYGQIWLR